MPPRQRLTQAERRSLLVDAGARLFAAHGYDDVVMEQVADAAGVSRALLYRHFPGKRELFAAVYRRASDDLLAASPLVPDLPLGEQVRAGLDAHLDYFVANRRTVLAANRTLAGDPAIQAIISGELDELRDRLAGVVPRFAAGGRSPELLVPVLSSWLVFVRVLTVDWLAGPGEDRDELRDICLGALWGALGIDP